MYFGSWSGSRDCVWCNTYFIRVSAISGIYGQKEHILRVFSLVHEWRAISWATFLSWLQTLMMPEEKLCTVNKCHLHHVVQKPQSTQISKNRQETKQGHDTYTQDNLKNTCVRLTRQDITLQTYLATFFGGASIFNVLRMHLYVCAQLWCMLCVVMAWN